MMKLALVLTSATLLAACGSWHPPPGGYYQPPPPLETNPFAIRNQMHPASPAPATSYQTPQQGVTAVWTGRSVPAQSVTGLSLFQCEYNYAGRSFVRDFQGSCPSTIQIQ